MKFNLVYSDNLKIALSATFSAGKIIMKIYNSEDFEVEFKQDNSPLTKADKESHKIISDSLITTKMPILSEEDDIHSYELRKSWKSFWMIDPIDGTKEFIKRNGEFTINLALIKENSPVLGVVYAPVTKELYFAEHGLGSFKVENISDLKQLENASFIDLSNSSNNLPNIFTLVISKSHMNQETQDYINKMKIKYDSVLSKSFGSSLKICKVAEGYAHCYPRFGPTMEWDTAAAHAVAKYSGCKILDVKRLEPLAYNKKKLLNPHFIVSRN